MTTDRFVVSVANNNQGTMRFVTLLPYSSFSHSRRTISSHKAHSRRREKVVDVRHIISKYDFLKTLPTDSRDGSLHQRSDGTSSSHLSILRDSRRYFDEHESQLPFGRYTCAVVELFPVLLALQMFTRLILYHSIPKDYTSDLRHS